MWTCSKCGKQYDGKHHTVTYDWLQANAPKVIVRTPHTLMTDRELPRGEWSGVEYTCGTVCPHCGHADDAPGFAEGDDVPFQDADGMWISATRYIPPQQVYTADTMI